MGFVVIPGYIEEPGEQVAQLLFGLSLLGIIPFFILTVAKVRHLTHPSKERRAVDVLFLAIGLGMLPACLSVVCTLWPSQHYTEIADIISIEAKYQYIAYKRMGELIAKNHPNEKLLLIRHEEQGAFDNQNPLYQAIDNGLEDGLAGKVEIVGTEALGDEELGLVGPTFRMTTFNLEKLNDMLNKNRECDVILSTVGVPVNFKESSKWQAGSLAPMPALYITNLWQDDVISDSFKAGYLRGVLAEMPIPFDYRAPVPADESEAFDLRFFLMTPQNYTNPFPPNRTAVGAEAVINETPVPIDPEKLVAIAGSGVFYITIGIYAVWRIRKNRRDEAVPTP